MKLKLAFLMLLGILPFLGRAQGVVTIFSEDGDRFYLVLNGVRQNQAPQTNVRVDGLTNDFYNAKVVFEDGNKPEISKNIPTKDAASGQFQEMTFKIKKTKDGELKMRFFGMTPVPVSYNPPPDMYVCHYGQAPQANTVSQTTVTTTTTDQGGNGRVSFGVGATPPGNGGVGITVVTQDPNSTVTQTTTTSYTTTTTTNGYNNGNASSNGQMGAAPGCQYPMDWNSFKSAKATVENASFEDTKLSTAKSILASNCLNTDQVMAICKVFNFEDSKLAFAKMAYSKTTDPGNYFKVGNVFNFDASKTDLNNFIANGGR
jgi:Domain of unknown function (DUF4476)